MSNGGRKNALQIVHLCLAQSEIAKAFDDGRAVPFVELESDCFVPAWLCIRPVITQAQRGQILDYLTLEIGIMYQKLIQTCTRPRVCNHHMLF